MHRTSEADLSNSTAGHNAVDCSLLAMNKLQPNVLAGLIECYEDIA